MTNNQILGSLDVLRKLANTNLRGGLLMAVTCNINAVQAHLKVLAEARSKIVTSNARRDKDGKLVYKQQDGKPTDQVEIQDEITFNKQITELLDQDVSEVVKIMKIKPEQLDQIELQPAEFAQILWMVVA